MSGSMITPEYVVDYFAKNDTTIQELKTKVNTLELEKALISERNNSLNLRINNLEQQLRDINNTLMNHFAYRVQDFKKVDPVPVPAPNNITFGPPPGFTAPSSSNVPTLGTSPSPTFTFPSNPFKM
jgi:hypothetical protein